MIVDGAASFVVDDLINDVREEEDDDVFLQAKLRNMYFFVFYFSF